MLKTLLKIGEWQSQGKSEWDRFLDAPKIVTEDKKGMAIKNYVLPLIFDLDNHDIIVDSEYLCEYDAKYVSDWKAIKVQGGNNKAIYITAAGNKINQIYKTFFGKEGDDTLNGELSEAFLKFDSNLLTDNFRVLLESIFVLKDVFWEKFTIEKRNGEKELKIKSIEERLGFSNNQNLVLVTVAIKNRKLFGDSIKYFSEISEYLTFLEKKFLKEETFESHKNTNPSKSKLCYASGSAQNDVEGLNLSSRFSLNKMFVEETKNYATNFNKNRFSANYQVSQSNQEKLDYASNYLLNEGKLRVRIANIDHVIIPQFQEHTDVDMEMTLNEIKTKSDFLFGFHDFEFFVKNIEDEVVGIFWLNFLAYESDGNFFKSTELIKDVSSFHFQKILNVFRKIHIEFLEIKGFNWSTILTEYGNVKRFNLNSIYSLIPIRKDKEKKNKALFLFKSILENRTIEKEKLFSYFCELILCHYYERYRSYTNIKPASKDYFYQSIRNSTYKYLAFFEVLKKLNFIDMNEENNLTPEEFGNKYDQAIHNFFMKMNFNPHQQAMFYLGRMLNAVEFIQKRKKKTVIEKVNFNGMDRDDIQRLRISLIEKAKQYNRIGKVVFTDRKFGELFDFNGWEMNPQETVFFLLTGYSFGISTNEANNLEESEEQNNNL